MKKKDEHNKLKYPVRSLRLSEEAWKELKAQREQDGTSWNIFIKKMIEKYGDK
jgi:hypothetical protein